MTVHEHSARDIADGAHAGQRHTDVEFVAQDFERDVHAFFSQCTEPVQICAADET